MTNMSPYRFSKPVARSTLCRLQTHTHPPDSCSRKAMHSLTSCTSQTMNSCHMGDNTLVGTRIPLSAASQVQAYADEHSNGHHGRMVNVTQDKCAAHKLSIQNPSVHPSIHPSIQPSIHPPNGVNVMQELEQTSGATNGNSSRGRSLHARNAMPNSSMSFVAHTAQPRSRSSSPHTSRFLHPAQVCPALSCTASPALHCCRLSCNCLWRSIHCLVTLLARRLLNTISPTTL